MSDPIPVRASVEMRLTQHRDRMLSFDLARLSWVVHGLHSDLRFAPELLDLIEVARVVGEFDRRQPKRTTTARPRRVRIEVPVRRPGRWTAQAKEALADLLRVQGNCEWDLQVSSRGNARNGTDEAFPIRPAGKKNEGRPPKAVILFSGGLDSSSGAAGFADKAEKYLLASHFTRNRTKQQRIAALLGYPRHIQVTNSWPSAEGSARAGGRYWYRSFLFLSLAAAFAQAAGTRRIFQFENGPLALAVPPLSIYRITRHAHPLVHAHFTRLVELLTAGEFRPEISNPHLALTKGEAVAQLRAAFPATYPEVIRETESCWYLSSRTIVAGAPRKKNGVPCGACIPCLIRKAALRAEEVATGVDFTNSSDPNAHDPVVRVHFDAYTAFANRVLSEDYTVWNLIDDMPQATRDVLGKRGSLTFEGVMDVYRRFAMEWRACFS